jgi:hypothetical protein
MKSKVHLCSKNLYLPTRTYLTRTFADSFAEFKGTFKYFPVLDDVLWYLTKIEQNLTKFQ